MKKINGLFRNGCIAAVGAISAGSAFAEGSMADGAAAALDAAQSDVATTGPKVLAVVAAVVGVGILINLIRKA
ncbi:Flexible pilin [Aeromonas sobria]|uniref:Flexible pilin n=1 Tax=Aeromonas sobria TaxID=646 RepID=UPI003CFCA6B4